MGKDNWAKRSDKLTKYNLRHIFFEKACKK